MTTPHNRAAWLARHVMPYELSLRQRLKAYRVVGLDIDDVVQEAYAILSALESVEHIRSPQQYAYQTACSIILNQMKRMRTVSITPVPHIEELAGTSDAPSPEAVVSDRECLRNVEEALKRLPQRVHDVFRLRRIEGLSQREVAERLGISENIVEKSMVQGLQMLVIALRRDGKTSAIYPFSKRTAVSRSALAEHPLTNERVKVEIEDA